MYIYVRTLQKVSGCNFFYKECNLNGNNFHSLFVFILIFLPSFYVQSVPVKVFCISIYWKQKPETENGEIKDEITKGYVTDSKRIDKDR